MKRSEAEANEFFKRVRERGRAKQGLNANISTMLKATKGVFRRGPQSRCREVEKRYDESRGIFIVEKAREWPCDCQMRPVGSRLASLEIRVCPRCIGRFIVIDGDYYGGVLIDGRVYGGIKTAKYGDALGYGIPCTGRVNQKYCPACKEAEQKKRADRKLTPRFCICGADISHKKADAKTCSVRCRQALSRGKRNCRASR